MLRHGHPPWRPRSRPLVNPRCGFTVARSPLPRRPASKQAELDVTHEHAGTEPTGRRLTGVRRMRPTGRRRGGDPGLAFLNSPARKQGPPEQVHCRALPLTARLIHPCGVPKPARAHTHRVIVKAAFITYLSFPKLTYRLLECTCICGHPHVSC